MRIDAHQHFWSYDPGEYPWIGPGMEAIRRDFLPSDLEPLLAAAEVDGSVAVQARQTLEETRWLLALAREDPGIRGVVGWVDLAATDVRETLRELGDPLLRGVRHIAQDEPDDAFLVRPDFVRGVACLAELGLTYDILIYPRQLPAAAGLVRSLPEQPFVLDHLAKPQIANGSRLERGRWEQDLRVLARHPNVHCKLSGMVTEARWDAWTPADLTPYMDVVLDAFGSERVMFGSDWPVCLLAARSYSDVLEVVASWAEALTPDERDGLFGANAARFYGLPTE